MSKTIVVGGFGPGISESVARKFGHEGFAVALVSRTEEKVKKGAEALKGAGVERAQGFACDLSDPAAVTKLIGEVSDALGPVTVLHWNAYPTFAGDLTSCTPEELRRVFDVSVTGLVAGVQAALPGMKGQPDAAVLLTGGGFAVDADSVNDMIVQYGAMGLGLAKTAQHKLAALLHRKLAGDGVYVGEVMVMGMVKGTAFDSGNATIDPDDVAARFWALYQARDEAHVQVG